MSTQYSSNPYANRPCHECGNESIGSISYDSDRYKHFLFHYYCEFHWKRKTHETLMKGKNIKPDLALEFSFEK